MGKKAIQHLLDKAKNNTITIEELNQHENEHFWGLKSDNQTPLYENKEGILWGYTGEGIIWGHTKEGTFLTYAIVHNNIPVLRWLIERSSFRELSRGVIAVILGEGCWLYPLAWASALDNEIIVDMILERSAQTSFYSTKHMMTRRHLLYFAAGYGALSMISRCFKEVPWDSWIQRYPGFGSNNQKKPSYWAYRAKQYPALQLIYNHLTPDERKNYLTEYGYFGKTVFTPLHGACAGSNQEVVYQVLLLGGYKNISDPCQVRGEMCTPWDLLKKNKSLDFKTIDDFYNLIQRSPKTALAVLYQSKPHNDYIQGLELAVIVLDEGFSALEGCQFLKSDILDVLRKSYFLKHEYTKLTKSFTSQNTHPSKSFIRFLRDQIKIQSHKDEDFIRGMLYILNLFPRNEQKSIKKCIGSIYENSYKNLFSYEFNSNDYNGNNYYEMQWINKAENNLCDENYQIITLTDLNSTLDEIKKTDPENSEVYELLQKRLSYNPAYGKEILEHFPKIQERCLMQNKSHYVWLGNFAEYFLNSNQYVVSYDSEPSLERLLDLQNNEIVLSENCLHADDKKEELIELTPTKEHLESLVLQDKVKAMISLRPQLTPIQRVTYFYMHLTHDEFVRYLDIESSDVLFNAFFKVGTIRKATVRLKDSSDINLIELYDGVTLKILNNGILGQLVLSTAFAAMHRSFLQTLPEGEVLLFYRALLNPNLKKLPPVPQKGKTAHRACLTTISQLFKRPEMFQYRLAEYNQLLSTDKSERVAALASLGLNSGNLIEEAEENQCNEESQSNNIIIENKSDSMDEETFSQRIDEIKNSLDENMTPIKRVVQVYEKLEQNDDLFKRYLNGEEGSILFDAFLKFGTIKRSTVQKKHKNDADIKLAGEQGLESLQLYAKFSKIIHSNTAFIALHNTLSKSEPSIAVMELLKNLLRNLRESLNEPIQVPELYKKIPTSSIYHQRLKEIQELIPAILAERLNEYVRYLNTVLVTEKKSTLSHEIMTDLLQACGESPVFFKYSYD